MTGATKVREAQEAADGLKGGRLVKVAYRTPGAS